MKNLIWLVLIFFIPLNLFSQNILVDVLEADELYLIYDKDNLKVFVQFEFPNSNDLCKNNSPFRFSYMYSGSLKDFEQYAIWELDYLDCGGITKQMKAYAPLSEYCNGWKDYSPGEVFHFNEADEDITASEIIELRSNSNTTSNYQSPSKQEVILSESIEPTRITTSAQTVRPGTEITLTVIGGALGEDASWKLYEGSCGGNYKLSSQDRMIRFIPEKTSNYYILAEGKNNKTNCVEIEINIDRSSKPPTSIEGDTKVCEGDEIALTQKDGELGPDSKWVWYQDVCNSSSRSIGEGPVLVTKITRSTTFYVRSESNDGSIIGSCVSKTIQASAKLNGKASIINKLNKDLICEGSEIILKAQNDPIAGMNYVWKENDKEISKDREIKRSPLENSMYKLEINMDGCKDVLFDTLSINVYKKSIKPKRIIQDFDPDKKNKSALIIEGGNLAEKSDWQWYIYDPTKGVSKDPKYSGKKESIDVEKGWKDNKVYVIANGEYCEDKTEPVYGETIVWKEKSSNSSSGNFSVRYGTDKRFFHTGIQLGVDYFSIQDSLYDISNQAQKQAHNIQSLTYFIGGEIHPIFFDEFFLGINGGYGSFFNNYLNYPQITKTNGNVVETGNGKMSYFGGELGWTISPDHASKMIVNFRRTSFNNNLNVDNLSYDSLSGLNIVGSRYEYNDNIVIDRLSIGFRFGAYDVMGHTNNMGQTKLGRNWDLLFNLVNREVIEPSDILTNFSTFKKISDWKIGFGIMHWKHSVFRMGFNIGFNSSIKELIDGGSFVPNYFIARFAYNFDLFR